MAMNEPQADDRTPSAQALSRIRKYVDKYREKTGTCGHPDAGVTEGVVLGLAAHIDEFGRRAISTPTRAPSWRRAVVGCAPATK
jgi:ferredoxin-thioredoxin reductase catalytic subunit